MGKTTLIAAGLIFALLLTGLCSAQGMGDRRGYGTGNPVVSNGQNYSIMPDYLNPYSQERSYWDPYSPGSMQQSGRIDLDPYGATGNVDLGMQLEPADPASLGLAIGGDAKIANQLYLQMGPQLLTQGAIQLGESYVLWAKVAGKGSFFLYDFNNLIINQGYVTPGWYRINGAYAGNLGQHLYRFVFAGRSSNNLSIFVDSGGYPTSFSLTGRVIDQSGQGIPGVRVIASNKDGGKFSTLTGRAGYYAIDVATGAYLVNAETPGYVFTQSSVQVIFGMVSAARPIVGSPSGGNSPF